MTCLLNALLSSSHDSDPSSEHHGQSLLSRLQKVIQKVYGRAVNHFISSMDTSLWKLNGTYSRKVTLPAFGYLSVQIDIRRIRLKGSNMIQALSSPVIALSLHHIFFRSSSGLPSMVSDLRLTGF